MDHLYYKSHDRFPGFQEETRHVSWTKKEKAYLQTYSKRPRNGVSETAFWKDCAEAMEVLFPGKSR
ncbi:hypothetical protein MAR_010128, partial [Mya arenaria]